MVSGPDSAKYLQNMLTNDINRLSDTSTRSIYAMILNNRGRTLHDVVVYRVTASDEPADQYLVEVDKNHLQAFLRMCKIYKIKKKVEISPVDSSFKVFSATNDVSKNCDTYKGLDKQERSVQDLTVKANTTGQLICVPDPRFAELGYRIVVPTNTESNLGETFANKVTASSSLAAYKQELYKRGIAENGDDISYGSSIPLEYNIVLMNGVSFDKGCYLGQELIAKTHHTGVIRKRIVPVEIECGTTQFKQDTSILNAKTGKSAGKLRGQQGKFGIAMLRLNELDADNLVIHDEQKNEYPVKFYIPGYWENDEKCREFVDRFP